MTKCERHTIIGCNCTKCGWKLQLFNIYVPKGKTVSEDFIRDVAEWLPPDAKIVIVTDSEAPGVAEVGFDLNPHIKLSLHCALERDIDNASV